MTRPSFAVLTSLDNEDRPYFNALLSGSRELLPATRAPTPLRRPRNDLIIKTGLSLQRLYRLQQAPRRRGNGHLPGQKPRRPRPPLHHLGHPSLRVGDPHVRSLRRLSLVRRGRRLPAASRRTFSRTHADERGASLRSPSVSRGLGSRNPTPFSVGSRGATPASFVSAQSAASSSYPSRTAVSHDEEAEIAVLADVETDIFKGMEALENAFEKLHVQAEGVREALRQRMAGLLDEPPASPRARHRRPAAFGLVGG